MDKRFREVGFRLRELRGERTQKEYAIRLGISLPALQNYEAGYRLPPGEILTRAARAGMSRLRLRNELEDDIYSACDTVANRT